MYTKTGYRQMLRERTPKLIIYALKSCKMLETWLNHVYKNKIWIYPTKKKRLEETRHILGLDKKNPSFCFEDTLDKDNLSAKDMKVWDEVIRRVSWFTQKYAYAENAYNISKLKGRSVVDLKLELMTKYLQDFCPTKDDDAATRRRKSNNVNNLADFIIDCFEDRV